jgi:hypothetical protein
MWAPASPLEPSIFNVIRVREWHFRGTRTPPMLHHGKTGTATMVGCETKSLSSQLRVCAPFHKRTTQATKKFTAAAADHGDQLVSFLIGAG